MLGWLEPKHGDNILDVGCGSGELCLKLAKASCEVHGADISENSVNYDKDLSQRLKMAVKFEVADVRYLPNSNRHFNKIICSSCIEHFTDAIKALKEMKWVLKPDGRLVLITSSFLHQNICKTGERYKKIANIVDYYSSKQLKNLLEITGFSNVRSKYLPKSSVIDLFV